MARKPTVLSLLQEIADILKGKPELHGPAPVFSPRVINDRFTDNGDGTITDKQEKVTWLKDPTALKGFESIITWSEAKTACEKLSFAGYNSGWRMPTLKEEQSIRDYTKHNPAWDTNVFAGKHDNWYWTSTECAWNHDAAWCVNSDVGGVNYLGKDDHNYVRPVRSCQ